MKSGCSGSLKPDRLGLNYKANKCSDAGTGETSPWFSLGECHLKYELVKVGLLTPSSFGFGRVQCIVSRTAKKNKRKPNSAEVAFRVP